MKVYVAGALSEPTGLAARTRFYERIASICQDLSFEVYVPHLSKKKANLSDASLTPRKIFDWDARHVKSSDVVIAYVGIASLGVGMELGLAACLNLPVITICERGRKVSPMILGHPCLVRHIEYDSEDECSIELGNALMTFCQSHPRYELHPAGI